MYRVAWSPTGEGSANATRPLQLASAGFDGTVRVWDASALKSKAAPTHLLHRHAGLVYALAFSPDGAYIASAGADRVVNIWSAGDGSLVRTFTGPSSAFDASFSASGSKLAVCFASGVTTVVDLRR